MVIHQNSDDSECMSGVLSDDCADNSTKRTTQTLSTNTNTNKMNTNRQTTRITAKIDTNNSEFINNLPDNTYKVFFTQ